VNSHFPPPAGQDAADVMRAHGYRVASASAVTMVSRVEDIFLAMQIGNEVTGRGGDTLTLPMVCMLRLKGEGSVSNRYRWKIGKDFSSTLAGHRICLSLYAEVMVVGSISSSLLQQHIHYSYSYLRMLVADARQTLIELGRAKKKADPGGNPGPAVHMELVGIGDLIATRSGLLKGSRGGFTAEDITLRIRACDVLECDVLPDIATVLHAFVGGPVSAAAPSPAESAPSLGFAMGDSDVGRYPEDLAMASLPEQPIH
jgi:hypothetical protein